MKEFGTLAVPVVRRSSTAVTRSMMTAMGALMRVRVSVMADRAVMRDAVSQAVAKRVAVLATPSAQMGSVSRGA